MQENKLYKVY